MATFAVLRDKAGPEVTAAWMQASSAAEGGRLSEIDASTKIQSAFRGHVDRKGLRHKNACAAKVQRAYRIHLARVLAFNRKADRAREKAARHYAHSATLIQKMFRGFKSRKYEHNFAARKAYLERVAQQGEAIRDELNASAEMQWRAEEQAEQEKQMRDFATLTQDLHHLVSTKAQPGIYNNPYREVPTAFDIPIEDHLRESRRQQAASLTKSLPRARPGSHKSTARSNVPSTQRSTGPFKDPAKQSQRIERMQKKYASVRASAPYDAARDAEREQRRYGEIQQQQITTQPWRKPGASAKEAPFPGSVAASAPYVPPMDLTRKDEPKKNVSREPFKRAVAGGKDFDDFED